MTDPHRSPSWSGGAARDGADVHLDTAVILPIEASGSRLARLFHR